MYAPAGCAHRLAAFLGRSDPASPSGVFDFHPLYDGHTVRHGDLLLTARAVVHDVPAYGLRAEAGGRALAYSGDTGPCAALTGLARAADLFLCEADIDTHREGERMHLTRRTPAPPPARPARDGCSSPMSGPRSPPRPRPPAPPPRSAEPPAPHARARSTASDGETGNLNFLCQKH
ncbi:hypothetical protein RKD49_001911 [Streptomyces glaucescens]